jgi:DNA-binding NarL/FixJ family response regulator
MTADVSMWFGGSTLVTPLRILVADDHELVRQGMRSILQREPDWQVCGEATTGREALAMALALKPDIVVLDIGLPEMNGVEVIRQIRREMTTAILVVTMHDADDLVRDAIAAGANGYILKAEAGRTIADAVRAILASGEFISERVRGAVDSEAGEGRADTRRSTKPTGLTAREREVLQLLAEGRANKEVAARLGITTKTVETHRARIMAKLQLHSMNELVRYAIRNRIIEP